MTKNFKIHCEVCEKRIEITSSTKKYCNKCAKRIKREQNRIADRKYKLKKSEKTGKCQIT